jgi:hypothetical protein
MIEKIAVARAVYPAVTGEASVERIAEPVDDDADRRQPEKRGMKAGRRIAGEHERGAAGAKSGEPVRGDRRRHMQAKPVEEIAFAAGENIVLYARNPWRRLSFLNESDALHQKPPMLQLSITVCERIKEHLSCDNTIRLQGNVAKKRNQRHGLARIRLGNVS